MVPYCPPFPTARHPLGGVVRLTARGSTPGIAVLGKASITETEHSIADANLKRENRMASRSPLPNGQVIRETLGFIKDGHFLSRYLHMPRYLIIYN
jgi:hypothetical protein